MNANDHEINVQIYPTPTYHEAMSEVRIYVLTTFICI